MTMIYGCITNSKDSFVENKITLLSRLMSFDGSEHKNIVSGSFLGGIYISKYSPDRIDDQSYSDLKTGNIIILSGTLYNVEEIKSIIKLSTDILQNSELIYHAFKILGNDFINILNGDFVIILYIKESNKLLIYRDHLGICPLAYTFKNNIFWFSSDIISLSRTFYDNNPMNKEPMLKNFKMIDFKQTPNYEVKKLLPGHYIEYTNDQINIYKYWFPEKIRIDKKLSSQKMFSDLQILVKKSVWKRCDNRYLASAHISGGLDSGIVAALARQFYSDQIDFYGFSWSPKNIINNSGKYDERELIQEQCKLNGIIPFFIDCSLSDYRLFVSDNLKYGEFFHEYKTLKNARSQGINLIFSGYGGDEFISKGDRGIDMDLLFSFNLLKYFNRNNFKKPKALISRLKNEIILPALRILPPSTRKYNNIACEYIKPEFRKPDKKTLSNFYFFTSRKKLHLGFIDCYYLSERMEDWYIRGMHSGVKYRFPLLDKEIVEYILKIPSYLLIKGQYSRIILREISDGLLPNSIRWNKSTLDPVLYHNTSKLVNEISQEFIEEIPEIANNPELDFIDFIKIRKDIEKFHKNPDVKLFSNLLLSIFFTKQLHEYIKQYKKLPH